MLVCAYCGNEKADWMLSCCGENHWEDADEHFKDDSEDKQETPMLRAAQQDTVAVPIQTLHVSLQVLTFLKAVLIGQGYQKDSSSIHQLEIAYSMLRAAQEAK